MQLQERGELALKLGFNKDRELEIEGYYKPKDRAFTETELLEAYVSASTGSRTMKRDKKAASLFQEFRSRTKKGKKEEPSKYKKKYGVFTWSTEEGPKVEVQGEAEKPPLNEKQQPKPTSSRGVKTVHTLTQGVRCSCCQSADFINPGPEDENEGSRDDDEPVVSVFAGKKYKPVGLKVRPVYTELPEKFRIKREITGDPLAEMPELNPKPAEFQPTGRYTAERKEMIDKQHEGDFLWDEERKLMHDFMMKQEAGFAWNDNERGSFRHDFFPPVEFPVIEHETWVERSIPIP